MSHEILKAKNEISMVLGGRKTIAPIFFPFLTLGCGQPNGYVTSAAVDNQANKPPKLFVMTEK